LLKSVEAVILLDLIAVINEKGREISEGKIIIIIDYEEVFKMFNSSMKILN